jgi:serine/threonine protein kinase
MSDPAAPPRLGVGDRLGPFEILQLLKEGGQATVYLARIHRVNQTPAQRVLWQLRWLGASPARIAHEGLCVLKLANPDKQDALIDEHSYLLKVRSALRTGEQSPHLINLFSSPELKTSERRRGLDGIWQSKYYDATNRPLPYIALPYLPGGALDALQRQRRQRPLPPGSAVAITLQICAALNFLHQRVGLVHHDVSPSNIVFVQPPSPFLPGPLTCVLVDLAASDAPEHPRLRTLIGKLTYLPPQRIKRVMGISPEIDVYGLGVVLYELLVGQLPQPSTDQTGMPRPLPALKQQRPDLSDELTTLVMQTVSHDERRWPSLAEFQARLEDTYEARQPARLRGTFDRRALAQTLVGLVTVLILTLTLSITLASLPNVGTGSAPQPVRPTTIHQRATVTPLPAVTPSSTPVLLAPTSTPIR